MTPVTHGQRLWAVCWPHGNVVPQTVRWYRKQAIEAYIDLWPDTHGMTWKDVRKKYGVFAARVVVGPEAVE